MGGFFCDCVEWMKMSPGGTRKRGARDGIRKEQRGLPLRQQVIFPFINHACRPACCRSANWHERWVPEFGQQVSLGERVHNAWLGRRGASIAHWIGRGPPKGKCHWIRELTCQTLTQLPRWAAVISTPQQTPGVWTSISQPNPTQLIHIQTLINPSTVAQRTTYLISRRLH